MRTINTPTRTHLAPSFFAGLRSARLAHSIHSHRNGITLLFVVSMIVLFLLMGTAFVVLAGDFMKSSKARVRKETHVQEGIGLVDRAVYDLIREPDLNDLSSPLRFVGLMSDMYGYGFRANVVSAVRDTRPITSGTTPGELIEVELNTPVYLLDNSPVAGTTDFEWGGLVLTFVKGEKTGLSTRIVRHEIIDRAANRHRLTLLPEPGNVEFRIAADLPKLYGPTENVIVNGRPFAGTGTNSLQPNLSTNPVASLIAPGGALALPTGPPGTNHAATNEPYDAFDATNHQNIFLAGINPDGTVRHSSFYRTNTVTNFAAITNINLGAGDPQYRLVDNTNTGQNDGIWIDISLQPRYDRDGTRYKPFVSYHVIDLDSRINVNFHGNLYSVDQQMTAEWAPIAPIAPNLLHRGSGYGVAEVDLNLLFPTTFGQLIQGNGFFPGRYGMDGKPGEANARDVWSVYKLSGLPNNALSGTPAGTIGREYGSALDIHGRFAIGYPDGLNDPGNPIPFNIGLPWASVRTSNLATETVDSAYEMRAADASFSGPRRSGGLDDDRPFQAMELERILRRNDIDVNLLPDRLLQLGGGSSTTSEIMLAANSITTHSFEVPTLYQNLPRQLSDLLETNGVVQADLRTELATMLAPEILRGLPMNINRPLPDGLSRNHPNGTDYPYTSASYPYNAAFSWADYSQARYDYARHLYVLVLLCTEKPGWTPPQLTNYRRLIAQWAINVVDFRDNDAIMSSFEADLNPWDGWDVDGRLSTDETSTGVPREVFWAAERPELLITETFASHDRRTEDTTLDPTGLDRNNNDPNYDSQLVPNVSFYAELYNPWVIDDANQDQVPELWTTSGRIGVDLQRTTPNGTPVWRMVVTQSDPAIRQANPDDPAFVEANIIRKVYFNRRNAPSGPADPDLGTRLDKIYFPPAGLGATVVQQGRSAVIGSYVVDRGDDYITYFGRRQVVNPTSPAELALTRRFVMNPNARTVRNYVWNIATNQLDETILSEVVCLPIGDTFNGFRNLGVSDPVDGYETALPVGVVVQQVPDGKKYYDTNAALDYAFNTPVDAGTRYLQTDGVSLDFQKTVHLQRLANPLDNYDEVNNPYRTIDSSPVNTLAFNGADDSSNETSSPPPPQNLGLASFERESVAKNLFRNTLPHPQPTNPPIGPGAIVTGDQHFLNFEFENTMGRTNAKYSPPPLPPTEPNPFAWLTWNNRPYVSQYELANVPYQSSYYLTRSFGLRDAGFDVYAPNPTLSPEQQIRGVVPFRSQFDHLLNFYSDQFAGGGPAPGLHRLFDFTEVPSRFVGTERYLSPANYAPPLDDTISSYRYPGKININTVLGAPGGASATWNAMMRNYAGPFPFPNWEALRDSNPFRPTVLANPKPSKSTLFRDVDPNPNNIPGNSASFLDYNSLNLYDNTDRSAYFRYAGRQRLGNIVTGRSSVFAIWVTVGYFQVNENGIPMNQNQGGMEMGAETGNVKRHRGFYILDRSIPVAFEPGKNHNIENAILVRRIIE